MSAEEHKKFMTMIEAEEESITRKSEDVGKKLREADEYEVTKLY
jgi:hypothetical protein